MFYLGIDIGKNFHVASLIDDKKKVVFQGFEFKNTTDDAKRLLEKLASYPELEIGMEATGHYWLALYSFLLKNHFVVHVVNPIQTDSWRNSTRIRPHKTDKIDSLIIADFIRYGDFSETELASEEILELRNLSRFRFSLVSSIGDLKRQTICVLDKIFPEYESVFSDVFGKTSREILTMFSSPADFEDIGADKLKLLLDRVSKKKFARKKLEELSDKAKNSFGITFGIQSLTLQLQLLIAQISFIEEQISQVDSKIVDLLKQLNSPITTIPGVGSVIAATILSEIGDIKRFATPAKLVAFAGLDSKINQSGTSQDSAGKMNKRGSPYLRTALFRAALVASSTDPVFKAFYQKKRNEGKHHFTCIGAVARKLCYTIHAILSKNSPYEIHS
ncbi:MAG: IS110 family transposase [Selenomonadaceae bacterium]|nr:IS110 family transposase [Selenomonadaceae bacterium]